MTGKNLIFAVDNLKSVYESNSHLLHSKGFNPSWTNLKFIDVLDMLQRLHIKKGRIYNHRINFINVYFN